MDDSYKKVYADKHDEYIRSPCCGSETQKSHLNPEIQDDFDTKGYSFLCCPSCSCEYYYIVDRPIDRLARKNTLKTAKIG